MGCPPAPVYKGARGRGRPAKEGTPRRSPTPTGSRIPPFQVVRVGVKAREGKGEEKEGGGAAPPPSPIRTRPWGGARPASPSPSPLKPNKAHILLLPCSRNSSVLRKIPEPLGTFPMSEHSRPIYRSLRLDHFETPRHVPDLIRDSKLLRYIKTHKLII